MSFLDKVVSVFAAPAELFEDVANTGLMARNWLVPWLLFVATAVVTAQVVVSNPSLVGQLETTIRAEFDKSTADVIAKGGMTQEEADRTFESIGSPRSIWFGLIQAGSTMLFSLLALFFYSLLCWVLGRTATNVETPYLKVAEVIGLTFLILCLEKAVQTVLMITTDSIHAETSLLLAVCRIRSTSLSPSSTRSGSGRSASRDWDCRRCSAVPSGTW